MLLGCRRAPGTLSRCAPALRHSAWIASLLLVAGCARYHARPVDPAERARAFAARRLDDPALGDFVRRSAATPPSVWPPKAWDVTSLTLAAFYFQPDLDVLRARWAAARAGVRTAGERPNPSLTLAPGYDTTTSTPSPWIPVVAIDIPIETAGKRGHRLALASGLSEAARLDLASAAWQLRGRVRAGVVALCAARNEEALLKEQQSLQDDNVRLLKLRWEAGAVSGFELSQARSAADASRLALRAAERRSAEAQVGLADAVGVPGEALDGVSLSEAGLDDARPDLSASQVRTQALLSRTDVLAALAAYAASEAALRLEIAKQYPDVHLGPAYQYDQGDDKWTLGIGISLPILSRNRGSIAEAEARRAEAAAAFDALQARVGADVDRALAGYRTALQLEADADSLLGELRRQEATARSVFELGEISRGDLVALRLQLSASALARLDAVTKAREAKGALEDALQTPLPVARDAWQQPPRTATKGEGQE